VVPVTPTPTTVSGQDYLVSVYIGTCGRSRDTTEGTCTTDLSAASTVLLQRVVVEVRWQPAGDSCGEDGCSYSVSTLIDPNPDATWLVSS